MSLILFWSALSIITYTYVLFPVLVWLRSRWLRRPYKSADIQRHVSVIIAAHNEAKSIGAKIENLLQLHYPRDDLEVIIASDGSTDQTEAIVRSYAGWGVTLLALPRVGKAAALNAAVAASSGEILVFSDANSQYTRDALQALVRPFADPAVGGVAGNQCYLVENAAGAGERSYWNFDRQLKKHQSRAGNAISATGAIYAIRRSLFRTVPEGVTDDFVTSTAVIAQGHRLVFAPKAVAYEPAAKSNDAEFARKVRVINRGLRAVFLMHELLNPFRYGFYAVQLFSHKVLRRLMAVPLIILFLATAFLWTEAVFYQIALVAQAAIYSCGLAGIALSRTWLGRLRIFALPAYFCLVNAATLVAVTNLLRGRRIDMWEPQRDSARVRASR